MKEWVIYPYITNTMRWVSYSLSWIGIDAYRSAVGMSKGRTESNTVIATIGFSGDKVILDLFSFKYDYSEIQTTTVTESQQCPGWTTMNWRPYITYYVDTYYGKQKTSVITVDVQTGSQTVNQVTYSEFNGENKRLVNKTTEVWFRVNSSKDVNAAKPNPPSGPPIL